MQPIAFCNRCRSMKVGWNRRYIQHSLTCKNWVPKSSKLLILTILLSILIWGSPTPSTLVFSEFTRDQGARQAAVEASFLKLKAPENSTTAPPEAPLAKTVKTFFERHKVDPDQQARVAEAVVGSSREYGLDPLLVASIIIVESRANPFAISRSDSVGIMQIHLPTWGEIADEEGINLFKVEDNIDFGTRILKDYVSRHGLWDGVKRYKGWNSENPASADSAQAYVEKVQRLYGYLPPPTAEAVR